MNVNFRHLRAFVAVAEQLHFTKAAETLCLTQPALSGLIRHLEADLRVKLLERSTHLVKLTASGQEFYAMAKKLLEEFNQAVDSMKSYGHLAKGQVTIAALPSLFTSVLPPILHAFRQQHPNIHIKVLDMSGEEITAVVRAKNVDFGISYAQKQKDIKAQGLFQDRLVLICNQQSSLGKHKEVAWADLENQPLIAMALGTTTRSLIDATAITRKLSFNIVLEPKLMPTALACVEADLGVTILPSSGIPQNLSPLLTVKPLINPVVTREISMLSLRHYSLSHASQALYTLMLHDLSAKTVGAPQKRMKGGG